MKSYLIKNKKYTFIIIFFICCFFLFIDKSYAYVYKKEIWNAMNVYSYNGNISNGNTATLTFNINGNQIVPSNVDYEYLVFKFNKLSMRTGSDLEDIFCSKWLPEGSPSTGLTYSCATTSGTQYNYLNDGALYIGKVYIQATLYYGNDTNNKSLCFMSSDLQDMILCPMLKEQTQPITQFELKLTNGGFDSFSYNLELSGLKYGFNSDSKEIINALSNLGIIQQNTTTTIQNFNNYVSNTSTTQAQTNQTTALGGMNTEFGSHLSQMNELTQLTMLPITFINNLLNNTCQPLVWDIPFVNSRVVVPCMSTIYNGYFSTFVSVFSLIMTSLLGYRAFIKLFNAIKGIIDAEDDKLEVVDL